SRRIGDATCSTCRSPRPDPSTRRNAAGWSRVSQRPMRVCEPLGSVDPYRERMRRPLLIPLVLLAGLLLAVPSYAGQSPRASDRGVKHVPVPKEGRAADTSRPDHVIGNGSPSSCTSKKVVQAVAKGGVITFDCGPDPVVITMRSTAKVVNT